MKKIQMVFVALLLMFSVSTIYAQTDSTQTQQVTEVERIVDKYSAKLADEFATIIESASPLIQKSWDTYVLQYKLYGYGSILILLCGIVLFILFFKEIERIRTLLNSENVPKYMNPRYGPMSEGNMSFKVIFYLIIGLAMTLVGFMCTIFNGLAIFNPEFYAIERILSVISGS